MFPYFVKYASSQKINIAMFQVKLLQNKIPLLFLSYLMTFNIQISHSLHYNNNNGQLHMYKERLIFL